MHLGDEDLQLVAIIDLVESDEGQDTVPIEFKRGHTPDTPERAHLPERVQLCAQALLLRAHGYTCSFGYIYFAGSRQRVRIAFDDVLISQTLALRSEALKAAAGPTPPPLLDSPKCPRCALVGICLPDEENQVVGRTSTANRRIIPPNSDALPLHIVEQGATISKDGRELVVKAKEKTHRVRMIDISSVHLHGSVQMTTGALRALMSSGIPTNYFSQGSWYYGRAVGPAHKNIMVRIAQFKAAASPDRSLSLAQRFVSAKIRNSRVFLRRNAKGDHASALAELRQTTEATRRAKNLATLLGLEGHAARVYFRSFAATLDADLTETFDFTGRNRRPPRDPINALLSFAYALLTSTWTNTATAVGLDPYLGFYHQPRHGRPALALDLIEEFRPTIADSVVVSVINRRILDANDFVRTNTAASLKPEARKRFIAAFERRLDEEIQHPRFGYRMTYRRIFAVQARLFARHLLDEIDEYPELRPR